MFIDNCIFQQLVSKNIAIYNMCRELLSILKKLISLDGSDDLHFISYIVL